jgi:hypothetical protein
VWAKLSGSGEEPVTSCFKHGNKPLGFMKCEQFLDHVNNYYLLGLSTLDLVSYQVT